jgi:hypothetical protein
LRRTGWVSRLVAVEDTAIIERAATVVGLLPTADPHALDSGRLLAGLVFALLVATGRLEAAIGPRDGWAMLGVRCDDIVGGLTTVGITPAGWTVPGRTPVTLPLRVLATCD